MEPVEIIQQVEKAKRASSHRPAQDALGDKLVRANHGRRSSATGVQPDVGGGAPDDHPGPWDGWPDVWTDADLGDPGKRSSSRSERRVGYPIEGSRRSGSFWDYVFPDGRLGVLYVDDVESVLVGEEPADWPPRDLAPGLG